MMSAVIVCLMKNEKAWHKITQSDMFESGSHYPKVMGLIQPVYHVALRDYKQGCLADREKVSKH